MHWLEAPACFFLSISEQFFLNAICLSDIYGLLISHLCRALSVFFCAQNGLHPLCLTSSLIGFVLGFLFLISHFHFFVTDPVQISLFLHTYISPARLILTFIFHGIYEEYERRVCVRTYVLHLKQTNSCLLSHSTSVQHTLTEVTR